MEVHPGGPANDHGSYLAQFLQLRQDVRRVGEGGRGVLLPETYHPVFVHDDHRTYGDAALLVEQGVGLAHLSVGVEVRQ